jgi:hypothetical protein
MKKFAFGCGGILLVLAFVAVVVAMMVAGKYNALVQLDQSVNQSWAQVQNAYQRRADLIPNLRNSPGRSEFRAVDPTAVTEAPPCRAVRSGTAPTAPQLENSKRQGHSAMRSCACWWWLSVIRNHAANFQTLQRLKGRKTVTR